MDKEYIDKKAVLKVLGEYKKELSPFTEEDADSLFRCAAISELQKRIQLLSTEVVEPVKHATWKLEVKCYCCGDDYDENAFLVCSKCGNEVPALHYPYWKKESKEEELKRYPYCNCGAKMSFGEDIKPAKNDKRYSQLTHADVVELDTGDEIYVKIGNEYYSSTVINPLSWNFDADEPGWEIETSNGFVDEYSLYREIV